MEFNKVSLAKALKIKNRMVERIRKIENIIHSNNSYRYREDIPVTVSFDIEALYNEKLELTEKLVVLKTNIALANSAIISYITEMAETKSLVSFISSIKTTDGFIANTDYNRKESDPEFIQFKAIIKEDRKEEQIKLLNARIDELQDKIDQYNATHSIDVPVF